MPNDLNGYINFMTDIKDYLELHYHNVPGISNEFYERIMNNVNKFENELKKYK
ncbi:hypothetical protein [Clostridium haemolyticum]|nr:hypothetical protein [Clostridium haemolyticum]